MYKRAMIYFLVLIFAVALLPGCGSKKVTASQQEENYISVEVEAVKVKTISNEASYSGQLYADKNVLVSPKTTGKVESINVKVGDQIQKGDILFILEKDDAEDRVEQANASLNSARAAYNMTVEQIEKSKTDFERYKTLYENGAISKADYEKAKLSASDRSIESAKSNLNQAQVAYNQAIEAMDHIYIKAPISGTVYSIDIEIGEYASNNKSAVGIADYENVFIQIDVTEDIINELHPEEEINIEIPAIQSSEITGIIDTVSPVANEKTQLYPVKIIVNNSNHQLKPGMFTNVTIATGKKENARVINSEAVIEDRGQDIVYIVQDGKALQKKVKTGFDSGEYVEILEGLDTGMKVIVKGQNYVENDTIVKITK